MSDDYEVGFGRPPKHTRFEKGRSGNPKGRPKGKKNLKTELEEELGERIIVREGGKAKKVSKQRAILKGQAAKAAQGDTKAAIFIGNLVLKLLDTGANEPLTEDASDDDLAILEAYVRQHQAPAPDDGPSKDSPKTDSEGSDETEEGT